MASGILVRTLRGRDCAASSLVRRLFCSGTVRDNDSKSAVCLALYRAGELSSSTTNNEFIGIDFGTPNIRMALMNGNCAKIIHTSPSLVTYTESGKFLSGTQAKEFAVDYPTTAIIGINRLIGKKFDDPDIQKEMKAVPYNIVRAPNGDVLVEAHDKLYTPTEIASRILDIAKKAAESYIRKSVSKAIFTFPSGWTADQVATMLYAGPMAGLELQVGVIEPFAAAISYGLINKEGLIGVFDLGGKSFTTSILELSSTGRILTKASSSDNFLGGEDFDNAIVEYLVSEFKRTEATDLTNDNLAIHRLHEAAEKAKIELSSALETEIYLPSITSDASGAKHLNVTLTRSKFESLVINLIERIRNTCERCLIKAGITAMEVNEVLLIGGMARIPKVQEVVTEVLGKEPCKGVNPENANVLGAAAAIEAGLFRRNIWESLSNNDDITGLLKGYREVWMGIKSEE